MIQDVDETLRRLLLGELPKVNARWKTTPPNVTFDAPAVAEGASALPAIAGKNAGEPSVRINLYLHDVRENVALRSDDYPRRLRPGGGDKLELRRPPVRLNLAYLVTAYAYDAAGIIDSRTEHQLLTDMLAVFLRTPDVPEEYRADSLAGNPDGPGLPLFVAQPDHPALADAPALWLALGGKLRPTLGVLSVATFDPFVSRETKRAREIVFGIGFGNETHPVGGGPVEIIGTRASVAGIVTKADGATPLPGVRVQAHPPLGEPAFAANFVAQSDERGFFALLDVPTGPGRVRFSRPGFAGQEEIVSFPPAGRPDKLPILIIALAAEAGAGRGAAAREASEALSGRLWESGRMRRVSVSGTLHYPDGKPAALIPVRFAGRRVVTDSQGFYGFFDVPEDAANRHAPIAEVPGVGDVPLSPASAEEKIAAETAGGKAGAMPRKGKAVPSAAAGAGERNEADEIPKPPVVEI